MMSEENRQKQRERMKTMNAGRGKEKKGTEEDWRKDRIKIKIHKAEGVPDPVFVGVNGVNFEIKPGELVSVPKAVLEVLDNAKIETKEYIPDPKFPNVYTVKDVTHERFSVSTRN